MTNGPSENTLLFPFADYYWFYGAFVLLVLALLAFDLGVLNRKPHAVGFREAAGWSVGWISLALLFGYGLYRYALWKFTSDPALLAATGRSAESLARQVGLEYLAGFVVEKSLAVDNIFIFVVVFGFFGVPAIYQHRVLFYGVLGALVFRALFIAAGAALLQYHAVVWVFGAFLLFTGVKMAFTSEKPVDLEKNAAVRLLRRFVPIHPRLEGAKFFVRQGGRWYATPLFLALVVLELSDVLFAVDSVPAIFALTREPLIVFTSNIFAILGLRSLYFLLAGMVDRFVYLKYGLAAVLVFVGLKMTVLTELAGGKFPVGWSLAIIGACLGASVIASWWRTASPASPRR